MTTGGPDADIRRAVIDCLELNGLPGGPRDVDTLTALWPLMRGLAERLHDMPLPPADSHEPR